MGYFPRLKYKQQKEAKLKTILDIVSKVEMPVFFRPEKKMLRNHRFGFISLEYLHKHLKKSRKCAC